MRIKHLSKKMKLSNIIMPLFWAMLISFPIYLPMLIMGGVNLLQLIKSAEDIFIMFMLILITIIGPAIGLGFSIKAFFDRKREYEKLNIGIFLKEVDLLPEKVVFTFFKSEYDFVCSYEDIEHVDLTVETGRYRTKHGYVYTIDSYHYCFTVLNGKKFSIEKPAPHAFKMKDLYNFIDIMVQGSVGGISTKARGLGQNTDVEAKLEYYLKNGYSKNYGSNEISDAKASSIVLFIIVSVIMFFMRDVLLVTTYGNKFWGCWPLVIPMIFMIMSMTFDFNLHQDMKNDIKNGKDTYKILGLKPWQVIVVKVLIIIEIIHIILP